MQAESSPTTRTAPNGGDGWLRYYTFDPAAGTMTRRRTYSPKLGTFGSDADSAFTPSRVQASPGPRAGSVPNDRHGDGPTRQRVRRLPRTWTGLDSDTWYEWRAQ